MPFADSFFTDQQLEPIPVNGGSTIYVLQREREIGELELSQQLKCNATRTETEETVNEREKHPDSANSRK
jgi:hypothetical protein